MGIDGIHRQFLTALLFAALGVITGCGAPDLTGFTEEEPPRPSTEIQVAGPYASSQLISGWYNVGPASCSTFNVFIPWGDFYLYADGDQGGVWSGNDTRFCVTDQAFSRWVDPSPGCPPGLYVVGFNRYYTSGTSVVTRNLNP